MNMMTVKKMMVAATLLAGVLSASGAAVTARFMKFVAKSEVNANHFASVSDLDIIPAE